MKFYNGAVTLTSYALRAGFGPHPTNESFVFVGWDAHFIPPSYACNYESFDQSHMDRTVKRCGHVRTAPYKEIKLIRRVGTSFVPTILRITQNKIVSTRIVILFPKPTTGLIVLNIIPPVPITLLVRRRALRTLQKAQKNKLLTL
jgi:hypothetical protein